MKIVVIGAGVVGLTTAYYLSRDGHSVVVIDADSGPGLRTSKANGSQLSYSFVAPLADPTVLRKLPSWLIGRDSPLRFHPRIDPEQWRWGLAFLSSCRLSKSQRTTSELLQLGMYSRELIHELVTREKPEFDFRSAGKLLIYQDPASYASALGQMRFQASLGCHQAELSRQACLDIEPALHAIGDSIAGGIFTPTEDVGDCMQFCIELERILRSAPIPVSFLLNTTVESLRTEVGQVACLQTSEGDISADAYVIANGIGAQTLARQVGIDVQVYPLKGFSLTYELTPDSQAPKTSVSDVRNKVVYARIGNRLRVAGMVDIGDTTASVNPDRVASLARDVEGFFPHLHAADVPSAWAGLRPARPDSKPIIGATPYQNLWLNVGHGALGFTLAAGSAGLLADQIAGRPSRIPRGMFALAHHTSDFQTCAGFSSINKRVA